MAGRGRPVTQDHVLRNHSVAVRCGPIDEVDRLLARAADQLVVAGPAVVAGYPWFGEWSRDTLTSYEGLFLETRREEEGRALLLRLAGTLSEGMLGNTADGGATEYNTADATLWLLHAAGRHVQLAGDRDPPHGATGCPFQAWSVAELLRARRLIKR
jgi:predicted glycogen debranching enzyme